jgi:ferrous iron transport protein A
MSQSPPRLIDLKPHQPSTISTVDWNSIGTGEARRLREFGVDEGVAVELLHRGFLGGTVACRIGRMTIALRTGTAGAIRVEAPAA